MSELWISTVKAAELLGVSQRYIRNQCADNVYKTRQVSARGGNGGKSYQIDLYSLPAKAQAEYWKQSPSQTGSDLTPALSSEAREKNGKELKSGDEISRNKGEVAAETNPAGLAAYNREIFEKNIKIVEYFKDLKGKALKSALNQWNLEHESKKPLTERTLYRIIKTYKESGSAALAGHYGHGKGDSTIKDEWFYNIFLKVYGVQGTTTSVSACREVARGYALKNGQIQASDDFPSAEAFRRKLKTVPPQVLAMYREGKDFWKRYHSYSVPVNWDSIKCGQIFVADHAKFDFFVRTADNKLVRPWISALCDYKSRMIVGYDLFLDEPNGNHIIIAMKRSFKNFGIPKILLFDNGKDYRRKDIGGGRPCRTSDYIEDYAPTITHYLGIDVRFAIPYNSQTKPIERVFGIFRNYFDKFMPGYVGSDGKKRPDKTKEIELKMAKANRQGDEETPEKLPILKFDEWTDQVKKFIEIYNHRVFEEGKQAGLSPVGIWQSEAPVMRAPKNEDFAMLCASTGEPVRVFRNVLRDTRTKKGYWAAWMAQFDRSDQYFYLRIDPENPKTAYCFYADWNQKEKRFALGAFIDIAEMQPEVDMYDDSEENRQILAQQMEIKNGIVRYAKNELKKAVGDPLSPEEILEYMEISVKANHKAACEAKGISIEDPAGPTEIQLTRFSGIAKEVKENENKGVNSAAISRRRNHGAAAGGEEDEEPKIIRFKKYIISEEGKDD
ncbi:transposase family protein [bacterium]|nr:transposase family protein [bacterium]